MATVTETAQHELDKLADKDVDSTDTELRYMAYGARLRTALRAASRYVAYTSDVGEAFRPVVPPWIISAAYGISWAYVAGDVGYTTWKAQHRGPSPFEAEHLSETTRLSMVAAQRGIFQAVASMGLPAFTIHTVVRQSKRLFVSTKSARIRAWGPTLTGLACVPILPYLFDHPVEQATDAAFEWIEHRIVEANKTKGKKDL